MRESCLFAITLAALMALAACGDYYTGQSNQRAEDPNAAIEANIQRLTEAQQKLSANPDDPTALSVILKLLNIRMASTDQMRPIRWVRLVQSTVTLSKPQPFRY